MIKDEYLLRNIRDDALIAIDALQAIVKEASGNFASERYLVEKASTAKSAVSYILSVAEGD